MNFAALKSVPVLFVCEDNALSNVLRKQDHLFADIGAVAEHFMEVWRADGTDVLSVRAAAGEALAYIRASGKPALLWCPTKRWMKHQGVEVDDLPFNPVDRTKDCPIRKLEQVMLAKGLITQTGIDQLAGEIEAQIDAAIEYARQSPFPAPAMLVTEV